MRERSCQMWVVLKNERDRSPHPMPLKGKTIANPTVPINLATISLPIIQFCIEEDSLRGPPQLPIEIEMATITLKRMGTPAMNSPSLSLSLVTPIHVHIHKEE